MIYRNYFLKGQTTLGSFTFSSDAEAGQAGTYLSSLKIPEAC